jgi:hypothetical protein
MKGDIMEKYSEKEMRRFESFKNKYELSRNAYEKNLKKMEEYEDLIKGTKDIKKGENKAKKKATFVRNIVYELIEAQVDNSIPYPKVTALKEKLTDNAVKLENKLRNDLSKYNFELMNDMQERITPGQGGSIVWIEWDNFKRTHNTVGDLDIRILHPKQFIPQDGVYEIEEMDYFFILLSQTKEYIKNRYGVDVSDEDEERPDIRGMGESSAEDKVTQIICYFRNAEGHIGRLSWVNDELLEFLDDYQARKLRRCKKCGEVCVDKVCNCGSKSFEMVEEEYEVISDDMALREHKNEANEIEYEMSIPKGAMIKYYKPDVYPVVLRRNTSKYGSFLGESDVAIISDMQNELKKIDTDTIEKLLTGGSFFTMPKGYKIKTTDENFKIVEIDEPAKKQMFDTFTAQADVSRNYEQGDRLYQIARNLLGITDSFQGRRDPTATSGTAKEFAARQTAGRLESKKIMKNSCYGKIFEIMAKMYIAFADEPRPVYNEDEKGNIMYEEFSKYDFIEVDEAGEYYYNVDYLFSTDPSGSLASSREAMWQETRMNFEKGCFGDPTEAESLMMFWSLMATLHYPGANRIKKQLEDKLERQKQEQMEAQRRATAAMEQEQMLKESIQNAELTMQNE